LDQVETVVKFATFEIDGQVTLGVVDAAKETVWPLLPILALLFGADIRGADALVF
jgi:hypothetical protein